MKGKLVLGILLGVSLVTAVQSFNGNKETKTTGLRAFESIHTSPDSNVIFKTYPTPVARLNPKDSERFLGFDVYTPNANGGCIASILLSYEVNKDGTISKAATASVMSPCL